MSLILMRRRNSVAAAPGPAPSWAPNLPPEMTLYNETSFVTPWATDNISGYEGNFHLINTTRQSPAGVIYGTHAAVITHPQGSLGSGISNGTIHCYNINSRSVYTCMRVMLSPGFQIHSNTEKFYYPVMTNFSPPASWALNIGPGGSMVGIPFPGAGADQLFPPGTIIVGAWQLFEVYIRNNDPLTSNGVLRVWRDGVLRGEYTNLRFHGDSFERGWNNPRFDATRGGGDDGFGPLPADQFRYLDRISHYAGS